MNNMGRTWRELQEIAKDKRAWCELFESPTQLGDKDRRAWCELSESLTRLGDKISRKGTITLVCWLYKIQAVKSMVNDSHLNVGTREKYVLKSDYVC